MLEAGHDRTQGAFGYPQLRRLLIRPGAIGDCIVSLPALEWLKSDYTEVWVSGQNVPLIRFADRVRSIVDTGIDAYPPRFEAFSEFDEIYSWYGTNRPDFRDSAARYPIQFFPALPNEPNQHATDFYMKQVGGPAGAVPRISCERRDKGHVAIHPFSGSAKKNWLRFAELAELLNCPVKFCASPEQNWPGAVVYQDLYELAQWLAGARLYIGNDSGITHLAAAVGTPTIAIFTVTEPRVWAPRGSAVLINPELEEVRAMAQSLLQLR